MVSPVPGLPTGMVVGTYDAYEQAQRAVDYLADRKFPVEHLAIVGTELRQVERVTGRMTWGKALAGGLATGAWLGLFVGLLLSLFTDEGWLTIIVMSMAWGALFMTIFGAVGYALTGGRRDFTSKSVIVAGRYEIYCQHQHAEDARNHLARLSLQTG
ncbi:general stress protein [Phytoactinopolyspora limicola]|uniref:general stress protein n=1 Tax=Phytoactinopolyspora limicola TaxID=2715536 RepID=UPI00140B0F13|nr:general stress protein [Phytoactinopolyspora limicola]